MHVLHAVSGVCGIVGYNIHRPQAADCVNNGSYKGKLCNNGSDSVRHTQLRHNVRWWGKQCNMVPTTSGIHSQDTMSDGGDSLHCD